MQKIFKLNKDKWVGLISDTVHLSDIDERINCFEGRIINVFDDYIEFAYFNSIEDALKGNEPIKQCNLFFEDIVTWQFSEFEKK